MNDNHKRRLLASLQHADRLLQECLTVLTPASRSLFSRYLEDVSPSEAHWVQSYAEKIREQFASLLQRFEIQAPPPSILSSWLIQTNLTSLDIDLEKLDPDGLRGYGVLDPNSARELAWAVGEIRRLVSQLHSFLATTRNGQTIRLTGVGHDSLPEGVMDSLRKIIARHRLVEFLPGLNSIIRKVESHRFEIAVFGRVSSGKSSLINRLLGIKLLPVGSTPVTTVPVHVLHGQQSGLRIHFADKIQDFSVEDLPEYATEQRNPSNKKRVVRIEVSIPSDRLPPGVAFVDTPGIASLATSGTQLSYAYLPDCDIGLVLVDGHSALGPDDLDLMRALSVSGIPSVVLVSKCDLLTEEDVARVCEYTRKSLITHLGIALEVVPVSAAESWAEKLDRWFVEFISPMIDSSRESFAASMVRKIQTLRQSLCATLESRLRREGLPGGASFDSESVLRPVDERLADMKLHWRDEFENITGWQDEILDLAASGMESATQNTADPNVLAGILPQVTVETAANHCGAFLKEYEKLAGYIGLILTEISVSGQTRHSSHPHELPRPSGLPSPDVSLLQNLGIPMPGALARLTTHGRERHFRTELAVKAGDVLRKVLEELRPRLQHWQSKTFAALEDDYHSQTDPLRYRNTGQDSASSAGEREDLQNDILLLRGQMTEGRVCTGTCE